MTNVEDMKSFVANELKLLRAQKEQLEMHICACEAILTLTKNKKDRFAFEQAITQNFIDPAEIYNFLENSIKSCKDIWSTLQIACLWSICSGGIPTKYFKSFQDIFLKKFGYEYLPAIYRLQLKNILIEKTNNLPSLQSIVHGLQIFIFFNNFFCKF